MAINIMIQNFTFWLWYILYSLMLRPSKDVYEGTPIKFGPFHTPIVVKNKT